MKNSILAFVFLAVGSILFTGCISHDSTVVKDSPRMKVEFENDAAARMFYEALSKPPYRDNRSSSTTEFEIPIVFEHKRHVVTGSNVAFNRTVEICDSNKDGKISELEARILAENKPQ
jgi:hypothetical protein